MTTPLWGNFVIREVGLARVCLSTKFKVSKIIYSKLTEGVLKFENSALDMTTSPLRVFRHP